MARHHYPVIPKPLLSRTPTPACDASADRRVPLLVLHGERDEIVPPSSTGLRPLRRGTGAQAACELFPDVGHNDFIEADGYADTVASCASDIVRRVIDGSVATGFEAVRQEFERNFEKRRELGAAVAAYVEGEKVVDLWGGVRDARDGSPWQRGHARDRLLHLEGAGRDDAGARPLARLARLRRARADLWPEFGQNGKEEVTVRQLLGHEAGVPVIDEPLDAEMLADFDAPGRRDRRGSSRPGSRARATAITA